MRIVEVVAPIKFNIESTGFHHGQHDQRLVAYRDGQEVGYIEFSVWQDEPHVGYIFVPPELRGEKIGTAMVRRLQTEFPDTEINMGTLTTAGSGLLKSIPQEQIHDPDYATNMSRLQRLQAKEAEYQRIADQFYANPTQENRDRLEALQDWNDLHDEMSRLSDNVRELRPSKRIFR